MAEETAQSMADPHAIETTAPPAAPDETQEALRAFLFTDIEGSTRLWERFPVAMRRALAQHDALLFATAERHNGHVFKTIGDAFCIAFDSAAEALRASLEAQRALQSQEWGQVGSIRVRMAIHQGICELRDNDYFGPPLNRSARLRDAGHGGQILVSTAVHDALLAEPHDPGVIEKPFFLQDDEEISFLDLGQHKLKDLSEAERVYQVLAPGLPSEFAKLRTASTHPNNLPAGTTSFVGRRTEARSVRDLLTRNDVRLVTLTGMGGSGKTRLALDVAADVLERYPEGVWFADLAPVASPSLVLPTILRACGLKPDPALTPLEQLCRHFREATTLLVLDNMEQVTDAAEDLAALLRGTQRLKILNTSRTILELSMEYEYAVPPLRASDCVALFAARAQQALPDFAMDDQVRPRVEAICDRLDHLPLAIELAAAQMRSLSLSEIQNALESSLDVLSTRMRDLSPRQRSLRGAIDWSYGLLSEEARRLFRGLSVFVGGFTPGAAEQICGPTCTIPQEQVQPLLERLRANSLVRHDPEASRFSLLSNLRQYGQEILAQESERTLSDSLDRAHTDYYLHMAEAQDALLRGAQQKEAKDTLEADIANIRAAEDRAAALGQITTLARFGVSLRRFWQQQGYQREGLERLRPIVAARQQLSDPTLESDLLFVAGDMALKNSVFEEATQWFELSAQVSHQAENPANEARALTGLGAVAYSRGDLPAADTHYERALELRRALNDRRGEAVLLNNLSLQAMARCDYARARSLAEESISVTESLGDEATAAMFWNGLGVICEAQGDSAGAHRAFEHSRQLGEKLGIPRVRAFALINLAGLALNEGDAAAAERLSEAALEVLQPMDFRIGIAAAKVYIGRAALLTGDADRAAKLCQEALVLYAESGERQGTAQALEALAEAALASRRPIDRNSAARLFLSTAQSLRQESDIRPTPQETERIARAQEQAGPLAGVKPDLEASLSVAERLAAIDS